jgi:hypothetical protein
LRYLSDGGNAGSDVSALSPRSSVRRPVSDPYHDGTDSRPSSQV